MDKRYILIVDSDSKNLRTLCASFEESGFRVEQAVDGRMAYQKVLETIPDLILSEIDLPDMSGLQLLEKIQNDPSVAIIPQIFLTSQTGSDQCVKALMLGAKDYMVKPLHVREIVARISMILDRIERRKAESIEYGRRIVGRIEDLGIMDMVKSFGVERKSGVLNLVNARNKSGQVYFRDGVVINATLESLSGERALYQMLPWERGHFCMEFKEADVNDDISVSNLGLMVEGLKRMERRDALLKELPSKNAIFTISNNFRKILRKKHMTRDMLRFISLFDGNQDVLQIIDKSSYDDLTTLERIVKLYKQGFLLQKGAPVRPLISTIERPSTPAVASASMEPLVQTPAHQAAAAPTMEAEEDVVEFCIEPPAMAAAPAAENGSSERREMPETLAEPAELDLRPASVPSTIEQAGPSPVVRPPTQPPSAAVPDGRVGPPPLSDPATESQTPIDIRDLHGKPPEELPPKRPIQLEEPPQFQINQMSLQDHQAPPPGKHDETGPGEEAAILGQPGGPTPEPALPIDQAFLSSHRLAMDTIKSIVLATEDREHLSASLFPGNGSGTGKLLIIGTNDDDRSTIIRDITGGNFKTKTIELDGEQTIELGALHLLPQSSLSIVGLSTGRKFSPVFKHLSEGMVGLIVMVDAADRKSWDYQGYLIRSFRGQLDIPWVIALSNLNRKGAPTASSLARTLDLQDDDPVVCYDCDDMDTARLVLLSLTSSRLNGNVNANSPVQQVASFQQRATFGMAS